VKDCDLKGCNYGIGNDVFMMLHINCIDVKAAIIEVLWAYELSFILKSASILSVNKRQLNGFGF
jgi:hypothetical protein